MLKWTDVLTRVKGGNPAPDRRVEKTDAQWRERLSAEEFRVTRQAGTENAFSSEMCSLFEPGVYGCLCCGTKLFDASQKFESGTGWPSFTQPLKDNVLTYHSDDIVCNLRTSVSAARTVTSSRGSIATHLPP